MSVRILSMAGYNIGVSDASAIVSKKLAADSPVKLSAGLCKSAEGRKLLAAPYSMRKLLDMADQDEYHAGCIDAIASCSIMQFTTKSGALSAWMNTARFPGNEDIHSILTEFVRHYAACGNAFLLKMRTATGKWMGLERMLPSEVTIIERYDRDGMFAPDYVQTKNGRQTIHAGADVIHFKRPTHKSNAWGLACIPVAINIEILNEIKKFDYNNFKSGLLIDYFLIVEGGSLRERSVVDENGEEALTDAYEEIEKALRLAKGNDQSHATILIESENPNVKIRLEPIRQHDKDGGFLGLKKDLREGIFAYHRVPPRIVSQLVSGQLGGSDNADMLMFSRFVISPLQRRLAGVLARDMAIEFGQKVSPDEIDLGDPAEMFESQTDKIFKEMKR